MARDTRMGWEHHGIKGEGNPPPCFKERDGGVALVIGSGRTVWEDLDRFLGPNKTQPLQRRLLQWTEETGWDGRHGDVIAVNDIGMYLHCHVRHWASLHGDHLVLRSNIRARVRPSSVKPTLHCHVDHPGVNVVWRLVNNGGLSGLFAAKVAILMGYDRVVMAGCPTDDTGCFFDPADAGGPHGQRHVGLAWQQEMQQIPALRELVRSMSGNTRKWLGEPEESWLAKSA